MFISPTEPKALHELGVISSMPEDHGVDIMWHSKLGSIGVQRKTFPDDFLSSMKDGRLVKEYMQMKQLDIAILLLEGRQQWTTEGELYGAYGNKGRSYTWSRTQHRNYLTSVQLRGIQVQTSDSITDTVDYLNDLRLWSDKGDHSSLDRRPDRPPTTDLYDRVSNADYVRWIYQCFPGVGPKQAGLIYKHLGMIFQLRVSEVDLMMVPGMGKGRVKKLMEVFRSD